MQYDVFISYARKDYVDGQTKEVIPGNIVSRIKQLLDDNDITYWFDEMGIYSGDQFVGVLADAIEQSSIFLYISTEASNASKWTINEIATAKHLDKKIIPFRYDGSKYNNTVLMYLAPLDYIDYQGNKEKAFSQLLESVKAYKQGVEKTKREREMLAKRKKAKEELMFLAKEYRKRVAELNSVDAKKIVSVLRTMGITTHSCPVCKTEVDVEKTYCPACGWTISPIDDIEGADYLSLVNYSQLDIARRLYNKLVDADKETSRTSTILEENRKLHKSVVELTERIEREEAKFLWGEQELKTIRLQRDALEQSNRELVLRIDNLLKERACICERQTVISSQTNKSQKKERTGAVHLVYADLPNKVVFEKALDKDVEACREMARRYYYGLNGYRKNIEAANNYLNKVGLPLYEVLEPSSLPKSLKFSYEDKEFYMVLSPDETYYMGNIKAIGKDFSWLNSSWFQVGGSAAIAAGAVALGVLAWPMAIVLFLRAINSWSNEKDKNNQANRIKVDESLCNELSKSSGYKFAKPTDKELEGVKQEVKPYCVVLRIMDNPRLKQV